MEREKALIEVCNTDEEIGRMFKYSIADFTLDKIDMLVTILIQETQLTNYVIDYPVATIICGQDHLKKLTKSIGKIIYHEEGTSYLLTAVGLLKNADNKYDAKIFIDWLLQDGAQMSLQKNNIFYMPTNQTGLAYKTINIDNVKLLDNKLGNKTDVQNRLMNRWIKEVRLSN